MRLLGKVESVFRISGRGAVVVLARLSDLRIKIGDRVQLRTPEGCIGDGPIAGIEFMKRENGPCCEALLLRGGAASVEIPKDAEIWVETP